jgi:hypothetical protein
MSDAERDQVPTKTTIHRILERHGRVRTRRRTQRRFHAGAPGTYHLDRSASESSAVLQ